MDIQRHQFAEIFDETQYPYWKMYAGRNSKAVIAKYWSNPNGYEGYDLINDSREKLLSMLNRSESGTVRVELFSSINANKETGLVNVVVWGNGRNQIGSTVSAGSVPTPSGLNSMEVITMLQMKSDDANAARMEAMQARWERDLAIAERNAAMEEEEPSAIQGLIERLAIGFLSGNGQPQVAALGTMGQGPAPAPQTTLNPAPPPAATSAAARTVSIDAIVVRVRQIAALFPGIHVNDLMDAFVYIFSENPSYVGMMDPTLRQMVARLQNVAPPASPEAQKTDTDA